MHPEIELAKVQVVGGIVASVASPLTVKHGKKAIVLSQLCLDSEAQTLSHLVDICTNRVATISLDPVIDFLEKPTELTQFADELVG